MVSRHFPPLRSSAALSCAFVFALAYFAYAGDGASSPPATQDAVLARAESEALDAMREEIRLRGELSAGLRRGIAPAEEARLRRDIQRQEERRAEAERVAVVTRELLGPEGSADSSGAPSSQSGSASSGTRSAASTFLESLGISPAALEPTIATVRTYAPHALTLLAALLLRVIAGGRVRRWLRGGRSRDEADADHSAGGIYYLAERFLLKLTTIAFLLFVVMGILTYAGAIDETFWLALIGCVGILLYALREPIQDAINGISLARDRRYTVGDVVELGPCSGVVEEVTLRTTTLRDTDGNVHFVPHRQVALVTRRS